MDSVALLRRFLDQRLLDTLLRGRMFVETPKEKALHWRGPGTEGAHVYFGLRLSKPITWKYYTG